jgi:hypothetical protein
MFKTKLLIFLMAIGCSLPLAAYDTGPFTTRTAIYNGQKVLVITGYRGTSNRVVVPISINGIPVRIIGENAFRLKWLSEVFIPEGIEVIGAWAFAGNQLRYVMLPSSIKVIAPSAFDNNTVKLATKDIRRREHLSVELTATIKGRDHAPSTNSNRSDRPPSVVFLSQSGNTAQEAYVINEPVPMASPSVTITVDREFGGTVVKLNSESGIGDLSYRNARLGAVVIPQQTRFIGYGAFLSNNLTGVVIPPSVRWIGSQAFIGNPIVSITIGENVAVQHDSFRYQFSDYYRSNNYRAGTYILKAGHWFFEGREPQAKIFILE